MASCKSNLQVDGEYVSFLCIRRYFVKRGKKCPTLMAIIGIYAVVFKLYLLSSRKESEGERSDGVEEEVALVCPSFRIDSVLQFLQL